MALFKVDSVSILRGLFSALNMTAKYFEEDFTQASEWTNQLYLEWKIDKETRIYIIDGSLPFRGYDSTINPSVHLFSGCDGYYTYFQNSKHIYLSSDKDPKSLLIDIYSQNAYPFKEDDWNKIFLVDAEKLVEQEKLIAEQSQRIEELERKLNSFREHGEDPYDEAEVGEHGNTIEKGTSDEDTRKELNKEARYAAKEYLEMFEGGDVAPRRDYLEAHFNDYEEE